MNGSNSSQFRSQVYLYTVKTDVMNEARAKLVKGRLSRSRLFREASHKRAVYGVYLPIVEQPWQSKYGPCC